MKKLFACLFLFAFLLCQNSVFAVIPTTDGTRLKCTANTRNGSLKEYKGSITDYYTFKNGKLYSDNLGRMFNSTNKEPKLKRVWKLRISDNEITFKDRLYKLAFSHYKFVTIDKKTGRYDFVAKKQFNWAWYFQIMEGYGTCKVVK